MKRPGNNPLSAEEIKELREYVQEIQALLKEQPEALTEAEWNEAKRHIEKTGEIPEKYEERIGKYEPTEEELNDPDYDPLEDYYDIDLESWYARYIKAEQKHEKMLVHAMRVASQDMMHHSTIVYKQAKFLLEALTTPNHDLPPLSALTNASSIRTLSRILSSNGNLRKSTVTRSEKIKTEVSENGTILKFTRSNRGDEHSITIKNPDAILKKNNRHIKKLLPFSLQKMQQQSFPHKVKIDLEELVRLGMYSTADNAWRGLSAFAQAMASIDISWQRRTYKKTEKKGEKTQSIVEEGGVLIYHRERKQNVCFLYVNDRFPITELAKQYTVFPAWAYSLPITAFDLVNYIFYLARINKNDINSSGGFNISLEAIRVQLGLPSVKEVEAKMHRKYKERIRNPIEDAIEAIEDACKDSDGAGKFFITPKTDDGTTDINVWLQGYIRIELKDEYADSFKTIAEHQQQRIEKAEKAKEKAIAEAEAKKILEQKGTTACTVE